MTIYIHEVNDAKKLKQFVEVSWDLLKEYPYWVPPLKKTVYQILSDKHPFYERAEKKLWIALLDGKVVGRIAAFINHAYNEFHETKVGHFGLFECIQDHDVAFALIEKASLYLKSRGMEILQGPVNPSSNYEMGLLVNNPEGIEVNGFMDTPGLLMPWNPPYYGQMLESMGLYKAKDLLAYFLPANFEVPEKIRNATQYALRNNKVNIRNISKKHFQRDVEIILSIYNSAWEKNWGFVPMSELEIEALSKELRPLCDERIVFLVDVDGDPAGCLVAIPDYNQVLKEIPNGKLFPLGLFKLLRAPKYINRIKVYAMGVKPQYQKLGIAALMYQQIIEALHHLPQYKSVEVSWVLEDNLMMNKALEVMGASRTKTYRLYERPL